MPAPNRDPRPLPTPDPPEYFEYRPAAASAGLSAGDLRAIVRTFEADYPADLMLRELHILRACNAIRDGLVPPGAFRKQATAA